MFKNSAERLRRMQLESKFNIRIDKLFGILTWRTTKRHDKKACHRYFATLTELEEYYTKKENK